jgi:Molecular chaperone
MDLFLIALKPVEDVLRNCEFELANIDEIILVGGMTRMPKIRELIKTKFGKEPNCTINPEEAVAAGAAIQAYLLSHSSDPFSEAITLLDTTSLSLGVETVGGIMDIMIGRGNIIPANESKLYTTDKDYVESVLIKIYEGERGLVKDNFLLANLNYVE